MKLLQEEEALIASLAAERPGVSRHRVSRALWRLGRRVHGRQPELLDDELATMDEESQQRRRQRTDRVGAR
jgi:hypothetical protein